MATDQVPCRLLIIGNGGSGKTWLAQRLAAPLQIDVVHLDDLHWQPEQYGIARDRAVRDRLVTEASSGENWIMEGVYGQLAAMVLDRVTMLVWLDLPEDKCVANVLDRGIQGGGSEADFQNLLTWIANYRLRKNNLNAFDYHQRLFSDFLGPKVRLVSRDEIDAFPLSFPGARAGRSLRRRSVCSSRLPGQSTMIHKKVNLALYCDQIIEKNRAIDRGLLEMLAGHGRGNRIGYIPSGPEPDQRFFRERQLYYRAVGLDLCILYSLDDHHMAEEQAALFACHAIHLSGGQTVPFLHRLKKSGMLPVLRDWALTGGVLIGTSAGAIIMTPTIATDGLFTGTPPEDLVEETGLDLVPFEWHRKLNVGYATGCLPARPTDYMRAISAHTFMAAARSSR